MNLKNTLLAAALACCSAGIGAEPPFRQTYPLDPVKLKNMFDKAAEDTAKAPAAWRKLPLAYYVVPPLSHIPRMPDEYPQDGAAFGTLEIIAAQGEYEPASFQLFPKQNFDNVTLKATDLRAASGAVIPASEIDLKVVKLWYQAGSAWCGFFADALGRRLIPELLLNDETLIRADSRTQDNYVRYTNLNGTSRYAWMSANFSAVNYTFANQANQALIRDADTLQPVVLNRGELKQFLATVHVPEKTGPGIYHGGIEVSADGRRLGAVPVKVRVLPFELPQAKSNYDPDKGFYLSLYGTGTSNVKVLKNQVRHNALAGVGGFPALSGFWHEDTVKNIALAKELGLSTRPMFASVAGCFQQLDPEHPTPRQKIAIQTLAREIKSVAEIVKKELGHGEIYSYGYDEAGPDIIRRERAAWEAVHQGGAKVMVTCRPWRRLLYNLDFFIQPGAPADRRTREASLFHEANPDSLVGWYANPHTGPENPNYFRRLHGLLPYKNNYDSSTNYSWWRNNWNDMAIPYESYLRGLVIVYGTADNVIDTLAWEGVREGMDDVRYATLLKQLARKAMQSPDIGRATLGRQAMGFLAFTDEKRDDLDTFRLECIRYILQLQNLLKGK